MITQRDDSMPTSGRADIDLAGIFRVVAETTRDVIVVSRQQTIEWVSPSVEEVLGYDPGEFLALSAMELIHPDDLQRVVTARVRITAGQQVEGRCRVLDCTGSYRWMDTRVRPLPDGTGGYDGSSISSWRVVDDEVEALERLAASEERYRLLVENSTDGVALVRDGLLVWASPQLEAMLGWDPHAWQGRPVEDLIRTTDRVDAARDRGPDPGGRSVLRVQVEAADGGLHWVEVHARPYFDATGQRDGTACSFRIVDSEVEAELELEHRARHDQLTGLLNRHEVLARLGALHHDERSAGNRTAVLFCDLDGFKHVNDTYGHAAGDVVLRTVATRVRDGVRTGDLVARVGGDELLVVLFGLHGVKEAIAVADQIRRSVAVPVAGPEGPLSVTVSIGVALVEDGDSADDVVARADGAMYRAKAAGRDGVQDLPFERHP